MIRRSQLFVPGNDEAKIRKSVVLKSDSIIFDLEDAVPPGEKSGARITLRKLLSELDWGKRELCIRINKIGSKYSTEDISLVKRQDNVETIVVPKAEQVPPEIIKANKAIIPLIETAKGLLNVEKILRAKGVEAVSIGAGDLANSVGGSVEAYSQNLYIKTKILIAAAAIGVDAIDCVYFELKNLEGFRREAILSRELGYVGKQVVHPSQVEIANEVYSPTQAEVDEARKIVEAYDSSAKQKIGAIRLDEKLIDAVHYRKAKALIEKAEEISEAIGFSDRKFPV